MLTGNIANPEVMKLPKAVILGLNFLRQNDLTALEPGEIELKGRELYVQVLDLTTKPRSQCPLESHRYYIDLQYLAKGKELIGYAPDLGLAVPKDSRLPNRDIIFYDSAPFEGTIAMAEGSYALFYPFDLHRPGIAPDDIPGQIRKIVVKIAVTLIK